MQNPEQSNHTLSQAFYFHCFSATILCLTDARCSPPAAIHPLADNPDPPRNMGYAICEFQVPPFLWDMPISESIEPIFPVV